MKITLSTIKADIGGIGGHTRPSDEVINAVNDVVNNTEYNLLLDYYIGYTGDDILFSSIVIKDDVDRSEITKTHTVALEANKWRGIPLGYNRGKSVVFQIDNADTIESIMYDLDIHAEVTV